MNVNGCHVISFTTNRCFGFVDIGQRGKEANTAVVREWETLNAFITTVSGTSFVVCDCSKLSIVKCVAFEMLYLFLLLMHQLGGHGMMCQQKGNKSFEDRTLFTFGITCKLLLYLVVYLSLHTDCIKNSRDTYSHYCMDRKPLKMKATHFFEMWSATYPASLRHI